MTELEQRRERSTALLEYRIAVVDRYWLDTVGRRPNDRERATVIQVLAALETEESRRSWPASIEPLGETPHPPRTEPRR